MNNYQQQLWDDLMSLVQANEAFYFADQYVGEQKYRIFNYRLASYSNWLIPGALECRGVMFRIEGDDYDAVPIRLASLPMEKFFNLYENPFTENLDLTQVYMIEDKADGSLISTYLDDNDNLLLKTKGSLASDQAMSAMAWLEMMQPLKAELLEFANADRTVNMEWVAPNNRIVLGYEVAELRVLNIRHNLTGEYLDKKTIENLSVGAYPNILAQWTSQTEVDDPVSFVASIPDMVGIEGYVVRLAPSGQRVKIKTTWYLALHRTKDNINSPRRLFEAVLEETTDDMRTLFHDDPLAIQTIQEMEDFVAEKYNHMVDTVERFYERNKHLSRKDYAILGQKEFAGTFYFGLAMSRYIGKDPDYKNFLKGKWKQLGLQDTENDDE